MRWTVYANATSLGTIFAASILHGVMVSCLLVVAPIYVESIVPEKLRSTAQGVLATVGVGFGAAISNVVAGWLFDWGGPTMPYMAAGVGALALSLALPLLIRPENR